MIVVATYECRSMRRSTLATDAFDNRTLNLTAAVELVLAVMATQMDGFRRLLDTTPLTAGQFGLALAAAVLLLVLWELAKRFARGWPAADTAG